MWSNVISIDKMYDKEFEYLYEKIKADKNVSYAYEESRSRHFLYLASLCESSLDVIANVENSICEVYLNHFKLKHFTKNFKTLSDPLVALTSALLLFDHAYEDALIRKVLSEATEYNIDGILNFRLGALTENWNELSDLISNLLASSQTDDDVYAVAQFINSQEGGINRLMLSENQLVNLTKSKNVEIENFFDNSDQNLIFAIIKEKPAELVVKNRRLTDSLKRSISPFARIRESKYD